MAGHSHWKQIQHKKGAADQKRGQVFSKLLKAISVAARHEPNPDFNPRLRSAIEKAEENNVPGENIQRAVAKALEEKSEEITVEAYGPEGIGIIIEAITDNSNRTIAEIKKILADNEAKMATPGSVQWAFERKNGEWAAKFPQQISEEIKNKLRKLKSGLEEHEDVQRVITNAG